MAREPRMIEDVERLHAESRIALAVAAEEDRLGNWRILVMNAWVAKVESADTVRRC